MKRPIVLVASLTCLALWPLPVSAETEQSRKLAEALKAAEGDVHYTEYPGVGPNSWDWLFAQEKGR